MRTIAHLQASLLTSIKEVLSLSEQRDSASLSHLASLLEKLVPALDCIRQPEDDDEVTQLAEALDSLDSHLSRAHGLVSGCQGSPGSKLLEGVARDIGGCLGLVLLCSEAIPAGAKQRVGLIYREMKAAKFEKEEEEEEELMEASPPPLQTVVTIVRPSAVAGIGQGELEDVVVRVKTGADGEKLEAALEELGSLIRGGLVVGEEGGGVVHVLLNRLDSAKNGNRVRILSLLRTLASQTETNHYKELMEDAGALSTIARSLMRDEEESREAVGLLLLLSNTPKVRQKIGRVQGCIVMLVTLLGGNDHVSSSDAGKLLSALSSNTQNVLLMAEAGHFIPLIHYLKEGSEMNKILMATAISKLMLTDQMKDTLGEEGSVEPLVNMFIFGKLEAKLSSLGALRNLSTSTENIKLLINSGIVPPLLQLLFSVTSVLVTLREPAAAILAAVANSKLILIYKDAAQQMLSLLNLSRPNIQCHLLHALHRIASHPSASKVRYKMKKSGALQLILPLLKENNKDIRLAALDLLSSLSRDLKGGLGEVHLNIMADMISTSTSENEKIAAAGILSNIPVDDKNTTDVLRRLNLLPVLVHLLSASMAASTVAINMRLLENIAGVMIRFTVPDDKKLQRASVELGLIPLLVKLLSFGSPTSQSRAAISLAQLSQSSLSLGKTKMSKWACVPPSSEAFCEIHSRRCTIKSTFCLVKACSITPLVQILEGKEREADVAALCALATLMQDGMWENGGHAIEKASGVEALLRVLQVGTVKAQDRALWMLERIFRIEAHREKYGKAAQMILINLTQKGDPNLRPTVSKILLHLQILQTIDFSLNGDL